VGPVKTPPTMKPVGPVKTTRVPELDGAPPLMAGCKPLSYYRRCKKGPEASEINQEKISI